MKSRGKTNLLPLFAITRRVGLKCARSFGISRLIVEGDSQLIVRQLTGRYQCREPSLKKFFNSCQEVAKGLEYFEIRHIPRAENKRADWLANHAMDVSTRITNTTVHRFCLLCRRFCIYHPPTTPFNRFMPSVARFWGI